MLDFERGDALGVEIFVLQLLSLILQKIEAACALFVCGAQRFEFPTQFRDSRDLARDDLAQTRLVGVGVERFGMDLRAAKRLRAVLTRNFELPSEELDERRHRHELSAHACATAAIRMQRSTNDQLGRTLRVRIVQGLFRQTATRQRLHHIFVSVHSKQRFDHAFIGAASQRIRRRACARQERECCQHDRFAGTGLARQDIQARPELEFDGLDESQVFDPQHFDHREHPPGPGCGARTDDPVSHRRTQGPARRHSSARIVV